jgi:hypothetical protein
MIRCIQTEDTPAFDRKYEDREFYRGRVFRTQQNGIPIEATVYLGNHGKRKNAELLLSVGNLHFRFIQADVAEVFDGESDEDFQENPQYALRSQGGPR